MEIGLSVNGYQLTGEFSVDKLTARLKPLHAGNRRGDAIFHASLSAYENFLQAFGGLSYRFESTRNLALDSHRSGCVPLPQGFAAIRAADDYRGNPIKRFDFAHDPLALL